MYGNYMYTHVFRVHEEEAGLSGFLNYTYSPVEIQLNALQLYL